MTGMPDIAYYSCDAINSRTDAGGMNCNDTDLNPGGCAYVMPNARCGGAGSRWTLK